MRILVMVYSFPPEISPGHLEYELSKALTDLGHTVTVVTAFPRRYLTNRVLSHKGKLIYREEIDGLKVTRVGPEFHNRNSLSARGIEYFADFALFMFGGLASSKSDVILCSSPPMTIGLAGWLLAKIRGIPMILRIGDIHPQALIDLGIVRNRFLISILSIIEKLLYQKADRIVVISEKYRQDLLAKGVYFDKLNVISNWVDTKESMKSNHIFEFRLRNGFKDSFLVTYAGSMSWPQDLETVVDSASLLSEYGDIKYLLVGDGPQRTFLEEKAKNLGLKNLSFLPLQPRGLYMDILRSSDLCLVSLKKEFRSPAVPSKLLDIMACGRPVIANMPLDGDAPRIIGMANCGLCVEPQNYEELSKAILHLYGNPGLRQDMGKNGREYFKRHFSLDSCSENYDKIFREAIRSSSRTSKFVA